jgi:hypothetical protein
VDKHSLLQIVRNCSATATEVDDVLSMRAAYPYSQVLHALSAKLSKDLHLDTEQSCLQTAAVYSTDRAVLKELMTAEVAEVPPIANGEEHGSITVEESVSEKQPDYIVKETDSNKLESAIRQSSDRAEWKIPLDVAETVMNDLRKLHDAKHNFEMLFADQSLVSFPAEPVVDGQEKKVASVGRKKRKEHFPEAIIEEIQTNKEQLEPESERQKEQIEIIDHFIKTQPSISNPKERQAAAANDLNSIKPGEFGDNIISETLVEILVKQGKKERAIEVLKKLIWKYPQKKAYFASQIEELRK